jgi:hypothetical protein
MVQRKRYSKTTIADARKNLKDEDSPEKLREEFPNELIQSFVTCHDEHYSDTAYNAFVIIAKKFLGDKYNNSIEQGKLTVRLTRATFDLVDKCKKRKGIVSK